MPLGPDPEALASLLAVQSTGSVTAAAQVRHLTQPALSRQLQRLARALGVPLLQRTGRGVRLTAAGEALAAFARRQVDAWEGLCEGLRSGALPPLRLGCGSTLAVSLLPAALTHLRRAQPRLTVRVLAGDSGLTATRLLAGDLDAGLVTTAAADARLLALAVAQDPVLVVAPPDGPARLRLVDLAAAPLCLYARGTGFRAFVDELFARAGLWPQPVAEVDSLDAVRALVGAGLGLSLLPASVAAPGLAAGALRRVEVPDLPPAARTITLLRRADLPPHPAFEPLHAALASAGQGLRAEPAPLRDALSPGEA